MHVHVLEAFAVFLDDSAKNTYYSHVNMPATDSFITWLLKGETFLNVKGDFDIQRWPDPLLGCLVLLVR